MVRDVKNHPTELNLFLFLFLFIPPTADLGDRWWLSVVKTLISESSACSLKIKEFQIEIKKFYKPLKHHRNINLFEKGARRKFEIEGSKENNRFISFESLRRRLKI